MSDRLYFSAVAGLLGLSLAVPTAVTAKEPGSASSGVVGVSRIQIGNFGTAPAASSSVLAAGSTD